MLRETHRYIGAQASTGYEVSPAAEWLLDNFHLVEAQFSEIRSGLPRRYFRDLPVLQHEPLVGLPRVYGVAWAFVAHTDSAFDEDLLVHFLKAYEETRELTLGELWALPTTLRVVLIENLRRLAERAAVNKAAREVANLCCDRIDDYTTTQLDALLALLNRRAVGEAFLAQMAQRLQDLASASDARLREWLQHVAPHLADIQTRLPAAQAADNLSVGNAITSLRAIGDADWPDVVAQTSVLTSTMMASPAFVAERDDTRDLTLHAVESLARRSGKSEREVAAALLERMRSGETDEGLDEEHPASVASHWLRGSGRAAFAASLGLRQPLGELGRARLRRLILPAYLAALGLSTLVVVAAILLRHGLSAGAMAAPGLLAVVAVMLLFPVSEAVVAVINRLISESARPSRLPRLALAGGIPAEHRVMVVIPGLLTRPNSPRDLSHRLLLHYLANPEPQAQFALLTDWADAPSREAPADAELLAGAVREIERLNALYPVGAGDAPRFVLLHRERTLSASEQRWMGWERKRGKLEQLLAVLAAGKPQASKPFLELGVVSEIAADIRYLVTLDSDTQLPPGRLRDLVGVAAHPHNQPRLAADGRSVEHGYAILQPHVATPLPAPADMTHYHWLFSGQSGIDPYSVASSEVYQDLFGEGTFAGKGLLHVHAAHALLAGRLPENQVLSHDLLEGSLARCAAVTDVTVIEDAPFHADVAASRVHRWTRGDWQLLPFLARSSRLRLRAVNRWKMTDNLRRSLVAPMSLAVLAVSIGSGVLSPVLALVVIALAFSAGPLLGALAGLVPSSSEVARAHFFRQAMADLARAVLSGAWLIAQLMQLALMAADAIVRANWRTFVSRRHLLQWTTAAAAQASATVSLPALAKKHWGVPTASALLWALWLAVGTPYPLLATCLAVLWALSPVWTWWVSRPRPVRRDDALVAEDRAYLLDLGRDTWRLFERCVQASEHALPPDNLQVAPHDMLARRTSPTNVGLYLLGTACARAFGWIGTRDLIERVEATLATLDRLPRHRGHFLNWYDTATAEALLPRYVSTVDSGNLCTHLLALAQACLALARAPAERGPLRTALALSSTRIASLRAAGERPLAGAALLALLAEPDPLAAMAADPDHFSRRLESARAELATWQPARDAQAPPDAADRVGWACTDHLATLASACRDVPLRDAGEAVDAERRLVEIAGRCQRLAGEADFSFLYHRKRRLFHIGFRVLELQLDASFYDLLASEARATSLWAIAKGDVAPAHWAALGRPFFAVEQLAGLRSWSGSMFEYLMPTLVLDEPHGSVLHSAAQAAVHEHIAFGRKHNVPWGVSESAYAASDHTLAYQYAPQGVPRLALRRTPADELVVAPYATALATQVAPHRATANLRRLEALRAREQYGFVEALDYTPARQAGNEGASRVLTFMAHHQGMSIVAIANVLLDGAPRRWGMADARIEAVASLLHERAPREVPRLRAPPSGPSLAALERRAPGMLRDVAPGMAAIEPTHLLSNGRYAVALRSNGAGTSRWGAFGIGRSRDDALRDGYGHFMYLRWDRQPRPVSITQHPAPDRAAHYDAGFQADRVVFEAAWPELEASTTVWVSPEDDIEFRRVVLRNAGERVLDVELLSAFEVSLADPRGDESHPAFQNLFVTAEWHAEHQAIVFERKPRLATDKGMLAAHFLAETNAPAAALRIQVDRQRWLGRNRDASHPLAELEAPPATSVHTAAVTDGADAGAGSALDTGLDPVAAIGVRVQVPPRGKVRLTFCTAAADNKSKLRAVIDKHRQPSNVERASMMSSTLTGIRLREMRMTAETFAAVQTLSTALTLTLARAQARARESVETCDRRLLWRFGISGDRPIVLVSAGVPQGLGLLRSLAQALRLWSWGGVACDLVVVNFEPASYVMELNRAIAGLREAHVAASTAQPGVAEASFHLLQSSDLHPDELSTLRALARVRLNADGRSLAHHVQELGEPHERALQERQGISSVSLRAAGGGDSGARPPTGEFAESNGEFRFDVTPLLRPSRPWVNVLANPSFGTQLSEGGGGYSWGLNSRLNMLTPWSNDPVSDPTGEWLLLQDLKTMQAWSVTPSAAADPEADYRVAHGQGYSTIGHRHGALDVNVSWCVDPASAVKQVRVRLVNRGHRTLQLRVVGIAEWIMGAQRSDRGTTHAGIVNGAAAAGADGEERRMTALLCTQRDRSAGFGGGTAFLALAGDPEDLVDWTADRRECFDARGRAVVPDHYLQALGCGLDPCAVLSTRLSIGAGETVDRVLLLGYGSSPEEAIALARSAAAVPALKRLQQVRTGWDELLGAQTVRTPDPLFNAMVNRWLLYQAVACRLWARAGFYQAGGAYGYRDQLQDAMALAWAAPAMLRKQIVLAASRQFPEGDVQHWWHAPTGAGVRTHFSDDLLWLPHAALHYSVATGDVGVYDEAVPFLQGAGIPQGAEDAYYAPGVGDEAVSVYEHCARAVDRSLKAGAHGLPLMGTGDWNDGMNRVGHEGRGESVWLAWFLCDLIERFAPVAESRGEAERAGRWRAARLGWTAALEDAGWDGAWYRRAFFDDGSPLGTAAADECRIDLIAQAWAVLSRAAPAERRDEAMASLASHLVDDDAGLVKLLDPPLAHAEPSAGYIQAYPRGVRENGGQYSHAGVWAAMAQAAGGDGDAAYRSFTYLSPAHRSRHPVRGRVYGIEPYVMAGDVYTAPPYVGRGGWSWYTGSAAWMHRAAVESMFGLRRNGDAIAFEPCLPSEWDHAELALAKDGKSVRILFAREGGTPLAQPGRGAVGALAARGRDAVLVVGGERRLLLRALAGEGRVLQRRTRRSDPEALHRCLESGIASGEPAC